MKFSFFLFGAIKFVLAEGGSAYGCGRVCVKKILYHTLAKNYQVGVLSFVEAES